MGSGKKSEKTEPIPLLNSMLFDIFETSVGSLGVFICKEFLANYEVLPVWMKKYKVLIVLVPSFTLKVRPFLNKIGTIIEQKQDVTFVMANLAQFGGSRVAHFSTRGLDEPYVGELPSKPFEGILQFEKDRQNYWSLKRLA